MDVQIGFEHLFHNDGFITWLHYNKVMTMLFFRKIDPLVRLFSDFRTPVWKTGWSGII